MQSRAVGRRSTAT